MGTDGNGTSAAVDEVVALHDFFERWFRGDLPASDAAFARLEGALAPDFTMVGPSGAVTGREPLLRALRGAHGTRPGVLISVERAVETITTPALVVVRYEEWQTEGDETTARRSTALLEPAPAAPGGFLWRAVHETWLVRDDLPGAGTPSEGSEE